MSSHHFVRQGQEPALLIDIEDISRLSFFDQLAGWNPVMICMEKAVPSLLANMVHFDHLKEILPHLTIHHVNEDGAGSLVDRILNDSACKDLHIIAESREVHNGLIDFRKRQVTIFTPDRKWIKLTGGMMKIWIAAGWNIYLEGDVRINAIKRRDMFICEEDSLVRFEADGEAWIGLPL